MIQKTKIVMACALLALCGSAWAVVDDPIAHWRLDEGSGTITYDSAGTNNGTIYGPTWTTGQISGALNFDGANDYVDLGNNSSLKPPLPVTLSAWIKLSNVGTPKHIITLDSQRPRYCGIWFAVTPQNRLEISYGDGFGGGDSSYRRTRFGTTAINAGIWYHVVAVVRGATNMSLYLNAADDGGTYTGSGGSLAYSSASARIGIVHDLSSDFNGIIDDVRVYNRALSAEDVDELYLRGIRELVGLEIVGPNEVPDNNSTQYTAMAIYDDNSTEDVTLEADWSIDVNDIATIDANGLLTTGQLETPEEPILISAEYTEEDVNVTAQKDVVVYADCTMAELICRNIDGALELKQRIMDDIDKALEKENRAMLLLGQFAADPSISRLRRNDFVCIRNNTASAIKKETDNRSGIGQSVVLLQEAQRLITGAPNSP